MCSRICGTGNPLRGGCGETDERVALPHIAGTRYRLSSLVHPRSLEIVGYDNLSRSDRGGSFGMEPAIVQYSNDWRLNGRSS